MRNAIILLLMAAALSGIGCGSAPGTAPTPTAPSPSLKSGAWELNVAPVNGGVGMVYELNLTQNGNQISVGQLTSCMAYNDPEPTNGPDKTWSEGTCGPIGMTAQISGNTVTFTSQVENINLSGALDSTGDSISGNGFTARFLYSPGSDPFPNGTYVGTSMTLAVNDTSCDLTESGGGPTSPYSCMTAIGNMDEFLNPWSTEATIVLYFDAAGTYTGQPNSFIVFESTPNTNGFIYLDTLLKQ